MGLLQRLFGRDNEQQRAKPASAESDLTLEERVARLEREQTDLHTRYRRLRAAQAAEDRYSQPPERERPTEAPDAPQTHKDALRARVRSLRGTPSS